MERRKVKEEATEKGIYCSVAQRNPSTFTLSIHTQHPPQAYTHTRVCVVVIASVCVRVCVSVCVDKGGGGCHHLLLLFPLCSSRITLEWCLLLSIPLAGSSKAAWPQKSSPKRIAFQKETLPFRSFVYSLACKHKRVFTHSDPILQDPSWYIL